MSGKATGWALDQKLPPTTKLVLVALADECRRDGSSCFPARKRLAECVGVQPRQISTHLAKLEELGLVKREERTRGNGARSSTLYHLAIDGTPLVPDDKGALPAEEQGGPCPEVQERSTEPSQKEPVQPPSKSPTDPEFEDWMADHERVTGHRPHRAGTKALAELVASYRARRGESWTVDDLKFATRGAHGDEHRRTNGYDTAESVLRPKKVGDLVAKGRMRGRQERQGGTGTKGPVNRGATARPTRFGDARYGIAWASSHLPGEDAYAVADVLKQLEAAGEPTTSTAVLERLRASGRAQGGTDTLRREESHA